MGSGSSADKMAKRIYSLAYHRAIANLKEKHEEEFQRLLDAHKANLGVELAMTGSIETTRSPVQHSAGEDGTCKKCGGLSPCRAERERLARARARENIAAG